MMRLARLPLLGILLAVPAAAQDVARDFPMDKSYKAISIGGLDVQNAGITFKVAPDQNDSRVRSFGKAGCNNWTATSMIRDNEISISAIVTTKMFCGQPRMTIEEAFLASLGSARRWQVEGGARLVIEGEAGRLVLTPDAAR